MASISQPKTALPSPDALAANVGQVLRDRRKQMKRTLDGLAAEVELSKGFLSSIENNKTSPSLATLLRLCAALKLTMNDLFPSSSHSLIRVKDRVPLRSNETDGSDELITPTTANHLQAIWSHLAPGAHCGKRHYSVPSEEELVIVLDGALRVSFEDEEMILRAGDTITFNPRKRHTFANDSSTKPAAAIFVLTPPTANPSVIGFAARSTGGRRR